MPKIPMKTVPIDDLRILTEWAAVGTEEMIYRLHLSNGGSREPQEIVKRCRRLIADGMTKVTLSWHDLVVLTDWARAGTAGMYYKSHISNGGTHVGAMVKKYSIKLGLEPDIPTQKPVTVGPEWGGLWVEDQIEQNEKLANRKPESGDWRGELMTYGSKNKSQL